MKLDGFILWWICTTNKLLAAVALPSTLSIIKCEILVYTSITCYWKTTSPAADNSSYKLQVNKTICHSKEISRSEGVCDTRGSRCSIQLNNSAYHCFCADVLESTSSGFIRSPHFCFNGVNHVKLHPPTITHLGPSLERSGCFQVGWKMRYTLPDSERIQVEYTTHEQTRSRTVQAYSNRMELCDLYPGSTYTVKVRAQDSQAPAHWSSWTSEEFTTVEKAPSAAPRLWRHIQPAEATGKRRLNLIWKPLSWPKANGVVLGYAASCRSDVDSSHWTCGTLDSSRSSCDLTVSVDACNCSLTAWNSAGPSPASYIYIPAHTDADLPPPSNISVISLDDTRLKVEWTTASNQSETGFVVQWTSILHNGMTILNWQHLNETSRSFILTGLLPEILYNVSVMCVYGAKAGTDTSVIAFTREGAPSVGPQLTVLLTAGRRIHLRWDPVPLHKLHGFIKYYSILYSINGTDKKEQVNGDVEQIYLSGLMEGTYNICVMAHTAAGGAAGPWQMVAVGHDDVQIVPILLCALLLILIILIIPVCMRVRIKQCLCPTVPDPSNSSLSVWSNCKAGQRMLTPSSTISSFFSFSQTSCYHGYGEKDYGLVQVLSSHPIQHLPDDNEAKPNTYKSTSSKTYMDTKPPFCRIKEPTHHFQDFINQRYTKPHQITPAGYQDDYQSFSNPLLATVLGYQRDPTAQEDLCDYIHVSQSYMSVTTVDTYRTPDSDGLRVLPESHSLSEQTSLCVSDA